MANRSSVPHPNALRAFGDSPEDRPNVDTFRTLATIAGCPVALATAVVVADSILAAAVLPAPVLLDDDEIEESIAENDADAAEDKDPSADWDADDDDEDDDEFDDEDDDDDDDDDEDDDD